MFSIGDIVCLTGISRHGKNRVRELGESWEVVKAHVREDDSNPGLLLRCTLDDREKRWVHPTEDNNFKVELWESS